MTATLFNLYETNRKKYRPGAKWRDRRGIRVIEELEVIRVEKTRYDDNVHFLITKSMYSQDYYEVGEEYNWSKSYMEDYYEPIFT